MGFGGDVTLSSAATDPTISQPWYSEGYTIAPIFSGPEFQALKDGVRRALARVLKEQGIEIGDTPLEKYHQLVDDDQHYKVVGRTRDLFPPDFDLDVPHLHDVLSRTMGFDLSDFYADDPEPAHIIVRVNRPGSGDFNPVHKDVYESVDHDKHAPRMINFWIPICGVGPDSALPIVPGSHLIPESRIYRTRAGSIVGGRQYHVNSIISWDGENQLTRPNFSDGDVLIFTSYLIHGLGLNLQPDTTRVALEFRLYEKSLVGKPLPDNPVASI